MLTRAIFAILWVTAGTEASAQAVTDLELKAAYCLGVANKTVEVWREDLTQTKSPERRDAAKAAIAQGETQRGRLWAYLRGRGFSWEEKGYRWARPDADCTPHEPGRNRHDGMHVPSEHTIMGKLRKHVFG